MRLDLFTVIDSVRPHTCCCPDGNGCWLPGFSLESYYKANLPTLHAVSRPGILLGMTVAACFKLLWLIERKHWQNENNHHGCV
ncbi:hypothetical protein PM082_004462 [Marasmius tenuissimus]|nr:hypothetical protein PM082_004462 [Marasmius tenuissimus]